MKKECSKPVGKVFASVWPLYGAAFVMAVSLSVLWTAMPFIMHNIGGSEGHVGYIWAANMSGYLLCLLVAAWALGHLNPRHTTRAAAAVMLLATCVTAVAVYQAVTQSRLHGSPLIIWTMIGAATLAGAAMSLFWPFLMSWVSADYEGVSLNRRLGAYNGMWSSAAIIGPMIGGALVDINTLGPVAMGLGCLATCFVLLCFARDGSVGTVASAAAANGPKVFIDPHLLSSFRWMARITLFCSWACLGVSRSQFALLFKGMGFSETQFGMLVTLFGIFNFLVLTGAGRFGFWHFKVVPLLLVQVVLVASLLLVIFGRTIPVFAGSFVIMGVAFGFAYSSHLYYGACGSKKRSIQMAIHEATISVGVIVGSGSGGYLAGRCGLYSPYWFAVVVLGLGLAAQLIMLVMAKKGRCDAMEQCA